MPGLVDAWIGAAPAAIGAPHAPQNAAFAATPDPHFGQNIGLPC